MMIQGQEKLCNLINKMTVDEFPRSLMLVGPRGSGRHLLIDYIANKFNLQVIDITTMLTQEYIEELYNRVEPYIYIINANSLSVKEENTILKFVEEPLKNSYIILIAETDIGLLDTVINRCQVWHLQNYTKDHLSMFVTNNNFNVLRIAKTPGQVIELCSCGFDEMLNLADKIITKIHVASVANTLTLSSKFSDKSDKTKYNLLLFVEILLNRFSEFYSNNNDDKLLKGYLLTSELYKKLNIKNLDHMSLFDKFLINLRVVMRGE